MKYFAYVVRNKDTWKFAACLYLEGRTFVNEFETDQEGRDWIDTLIKVHTSRQRLGQHP